MVKEITEEFITKKHRRLLNYATIASIFAWIILAIQVIDFVVVILNAQNGFVSNAGFDQNRFSITYLLQHPLLFSRFIIDTGDILLRGIVFWLILMGISMGLNMIVETDLNYRDKVMGGDNE